MSQQFVITDFEMCEEADSLNTVLSILKSKGAPVIGSFLLKIDPAFNCKMSRDETALQSIFEFTKVEELK